MIEEITASQLNEQEFIDKKVNEIREAVGDGIAINALSGGVDSSVVTMLGHLALGSKLRTVFIDNALMREGEPERVAALFMGLGINIEIVDARAEFLAALKGVTDPEQKREAITQTFYKKVFGCRSIGEKRDLTGAWLDKVTGLENAHIIGEHLVLPGYDEDHPTLEIFSYDSMEGELTHKINQYGIAHLAVQRDGGRQRCGLPTRLRGGPGAAAGRRTRHPRRNGRWHLVRRLAVPRIHQQAAVSG